MRLWSIHPKYLDKMGLLACWREGLLAQAVLKGETEGYKNHPQLERFKEKDIKFIKCYLLEIAKEASKRMYHFDYKKIIDYRKEGIELHNKVYDNQEKLEITKGQLIYELKHLQKKLQTRDIMQYTANLYSCYNKDMTIIKIEPNPLFKVTEGIVAKWEKI